MSRNLCLPMARTASALSSKRIRFLGTVPDQKSNELTPAEHRELVSQDTSQK